MGGFVVEDGGCRLGVPVGVNPRERRIIPAEGRGAGPIPPTVRGGAPDSALAVSSLGSDSTYQRSDLDPGRASSGAMLMEAYLGIKKLAVRLAPWKSQLYLLSTAQYGSKNSPFFVSVNIDLEKLHFSRQSNFSSNKY